MSSALAQAGYSYNKETSVWIRQDYAGIAYSDGDEVERRIASIIEGATDLGVLSNELRPHCTDWPSVYHLSGTRANILRPFEADLRGDILEIGAGCGAITRFLGECGGNVLALEGSPRRASIARARTRDLDNVTVVCDKFDAFDCDQKFDVITLIGVLEYANLFTSGEHPTLAMLERVRNFLKPSGKLIIAIENQLGLKYFAGAPEDHIGIPMYGIEGRYRNDQPQTFGRKELAGLIKQAGFISTEFLAPFPDYKLPVSIVTERGFSCDAFDAAALAWQSVCRDPQLPSNLAFSPELVWPTVVNNGLALDLANSFLIVASLAECEGLVPPNRLAWHYTTDRRTELCKRAEFLEIDAHKAEVRYQRLNQNADNPVVRSLLQHYLPERDEYRLGNVLSSEIIRAVTQDGWRIEEVSHCLHQWINFISKLAKEQKQTIDLSDPSSQLPGSFFDCIPQNIIISSDNSFHVIDKEWVANEKLELGYLTFRSVWAVLHTIKRFGRPEKESIKTRYDFILSVMNGLGWIITNEDIARWIEFEYKIQSEVAGRVIASVGALDWLKKTPLPTANLSQAVTERDGQIASLNQAVTERDGQIASLNQAVAERDIRIRTLVISKSWRMTRPFRFLARMIRGEYPLALDPLMRNRNFPAIQRNARRIKNALSYIGRGDFAGLRERIAFHRRDAIATSFGKIARQDAEVVCGIITPGHTLFIAHLISARLNAHGWGTEIMTEPPKSFSHDFYVVLCPQIFDRLPPGEKRVVFQLEQSVSSRWFVDDYFKFLENSFAVLEYSLINISFLAKKGIAYPHVHYLPIGADATYGSHVLSAEKKYDVLFYGDSLSSPRRRRMLEAAKQHFNVHVVNDKFGDAMIETIKEARVILNIHYYENALLEMPRIQESLSLGVPVVSELAQDQDDYPELDGAVIFFEYNSVDGMIAAIRQALKAEAGEIARSVEASKTRFAFMFDRFLVAMGFIPASHVHNMKPLLPASADTFGLSLPETINRRRVFEEVRPTQCVIFDGIRRRPGWVGCGLSYAVLAKHALDNGVETIVVMEDDVILPPDYINALVDIKQYLDRKDVFWDIFSGLIAHLHPETKVLAVEKFAGRTFVTINKMTSMVFNIYSKGAMKTFCAWDPKNTDADTNTIDRFIESQQNLRVVTTLPYFVGHREEVYSTLWGFQNSRYKELIAESEALLQCKVEEFLAKSCGDVQITCLSERK